MLIYSYIYDNHIYNFKEEENVITSIKKLIKRILEEASEEEYINEEEILSLYDDLTSQIEFCVGCSETIWVEDYTDGYNIKLYCGYLQDE